MLWDQLNENLLLSVRWIAIIELQVPTWMFGTSVQRGQGLGKSWRYSRKSLKERPLIKSLCRFFSISALNCYPSTAYVR